MATAYRGFSTVNRIKKFRLTDFELIKQDLINHFNIRKGEKLMNPSFGTIIWNVLYEPLTEELKTIIAADVKNVAGYDPRLKVDNIIVQSYESGLQIQVNLHNIQTNQSALMNLRFDNENRTVIAN